MSTRKFGDGGGAIRAHPGTIRQHPLDDAHKPRRLPAQRRPQGFEQTQDLGGALDPTLAAHLTHRSDLAQRRAERRHRHLLGVLVEMAQQIGGLCQGGQPMQPAPHRPTCTPHLLGHPGLRHRRLEEVVPGGLGHHRELVVPMWHQPRRPQRPATPTALATNPAASNPRQVHHLGVPPDARRALPPAIPQHPQMAAEHATGRSLELFGESYPATLKLLGYNHSHTPDLLRSRGQDRTQRALSLRQWQEV